MSDTSRICLIAVPDPTRRTGIDGPTPMTTTQAMQPCDVTHRQLTRIDGLLFRLIRQLRALPSP